jgi:hypothetical protein
MFVTNKGQLGKDLVKCGEGGNDRDFRRGDAVGSPRCNKATTLQIATVRATRRDRPYGFIFMIMRPSSVLL